MAGVKRASKRQRGKKQESRKNPLTMSDSTVLIVFLVLLVFIIFSFGNPAAKKNSIKEEQEKLLDMLIIAEEQENGPAIVVGNIVDSERLSKLASKDYNEIKGLAGISSDFVIYFEDEEGNVINMAGKPCIGSSYATVNGVNCNN